LETWFEKIALHYQKDIVAVEDEVDVE